jgi:hypothetical protein
MPKSGTRRGRAQQVAPADKGCRKHKCNQRNRKERQNNSYLVCQIACSLPTRPEQQRGSC